MRSTDVLGRFLMVVKSRGATYEKLILRPYSSSRELQSTDSSTELLRETSLGRNSDLLAVAVPPAVGRAITATRTSWPVHSVSKYHALAIQIRRCGDYSR